MNFAVSEEMILGPPKTAFASVSGTRKAFDSHQRASSSNNDETSAKNDRNAFRDKHLKDGKRSERDPERARDLRSGNAQYRRSMKEDDDLGLDLRPQRDSEQDGSDLLQRKKEDPGHDQGLGREARTKKAFENHKRDGDHDIDGYYSGRRPGPGRIRDEPSRYRDDDRNENDRTENVGKGNMSHLGWRDKERRGLQEQDRDWHRGTKAELDPEWMDEPESEARKEAHTQEDFERWKEKMKASNGSLPDTSLPASDNLSIHERLNPGAGTSSAKGKVDTLLVVDPTVDNFFGLWNGPQDEKFANTSANVTAPNTVNATAKISKPSKFTGFFNPKANSEPPKGRQGLPFVEAPMDSTNEDKEGFQRILKLLDQQQPQGDSAPPPLSPGSGDAPTSSPIQSTRDPRDLYNLFDPRSTQTNAIPLKNDSEFLLNLMQQQQGTRSNLGQMDVHGRRAAQGTAPGLPPFSNLAISPQDTPQQSSSSKSPGLFGDNVREDILARDKPNSSFGTEPRAPPGLHDSRRQSPTGAPYQSMFTSGLQRPPGLEQMPPGYTQYIQLQRQNMAPPPGFHASTRNQNAFSPSLIHHNGPNDRLQYAIPVTGRGIPPPGFMGINAAPLGAPPLPFNHDGLPFGPFGDVGIFGQGGQGFLPGQQRRQ